MEKKFCAIVFAVTFVALSSVVHGSNSNIHRGPSVEPIVEIDIEDAKSPANSAGFNFEDPAAVAEVAPEVAPKAAPKSRVPANIVSKSSDNTTGSMIGPLIFLIALPIGLWIVISRKISSKEDSKNVDYYPKTQQFKPFKTDYQNSAEDDDDVDFPKAS